MEEYKKETLRWKTIGKQVVDEIDENNIYIKYSDIKKIIYELGGCDSRDDWSCGWDKAIDTIESELEELIRESNYYLKDSFFCKETLCQKIKSLRKKL